MTLRLNGSTSGYTEIDAPAVAGSNTLLLPTGAGSAYQVVRNGATAGSLEFTDKIVSGTAVASTSGTSIDFTGIPSWVKRVTVNLWGVSTSGSSQPLIRIGSGGTFATTGYFSAASNLQNGGSVGVSTDTSGYIIFQNVGTQILYGVVVLTALGDGVTWLASGNYSSTPIIVAGTTAGSKTLSGTLDRVRITTVNGTDTFDAGSINILYE